MPIAIEVNLDQVRKIEAALGRGAKEIPTIIRNAVNATANTVEKRIVDDLARDIPITKKAIRGGRKGRGTNIAISKATTAKPTAAIIIKGKRIALSKFKAKQVRKGVTAVVQKSTGRKLYKGAFLATMKSGHIGAFLRAKGSKPKAPDGNVLPIIELRGPSVMRVYNKTIAARTESDAANLLEKNVDRLIKVALEKRAAKAAGK